MTEKEIRKFAKQNYLQGKTKQETFEELKRISYRTTAVLEKNIQSIPSLREVRKLARQSVRNGKTKQETFEELNTKCYRSTADLGKILQTFSFLYKSKEEEIPIKEINKRFKTISLIGLGLLSIAHIFYLCDITIFYYFFIIIIGIALPVWFIADYKMLRSNKHYICCLLISILFCWYYMIFVQKFDFEMINRGTFMSLAPIAILIIQKPARLIYKLLYIREPVVNIPSPTVEDAAYELIIFILSGILTLVVVLLLT